MQVFCVILQLFSICQRSLGYYAKPTDFDGFNLFAGLRKMVVSVYVV